ncbi:hypothetical protein F5883DRAFT_232311 [Diaporthe sp. PMI_573]|nr:hypothetical protein F5883DRAFT_232311 [Diaporthaceae sp. PMI_573]
MTMSNRQESGNVPPHLTPEARRRSNMVNMRRRREITVMGALHKLFLNCECQVYLNIHHTDEDKHVVYNSEPGENFPIDYSRLRNYYPKPQINTPSNPQSLLKQALARMASQGDAAAPEDHTAPVVTTGDTAAPDGNPSRPRTPGGPPAELPWGQPSTPPFSPPSMSCPPPAPRKHPASPSAHHESRVSKSPSCGRYKLRNKRGRFSK